MSNETAIDLRAKLATDKVANTLIETVKIKAIVATIPVGNIPEGIAITPNNQKVYVTNALDNTISVIDTRTNKVLGQPIQVGNYPANIAIMSNGQRAYVTNYDEGSFSVINTISDTIIVNNVNIGFSDPWGVTILPNNTRAYVADHTGSDVDVISTAINNRILNPIPIPGACAITVSPDGRTVYVGSFLSDGVLFAIDVLTNSVVNQITLNNMLFDMSITPDGSKLYIATYNGNVIVVKTCDLTVIKTINISNNWLRGIAVAPNGKKVYVSNTNYNELVVIDVETDTIIGLPYEVGDGPERIAITLNSKYAYVGNGWSNNVTVVDLTVTTVDV